MSPKRFAVVGHPIGHSRSPEIHHAFAAQTGIALRYEKLLAPLDDFAGTVRQFFAEGGAGLNVTVPFKQEAMALARDHLSERARLAAAVNTLWMEDGKLHGCNTDGVGLLSDLVRLGHPPQGRRILMLGAGGAARGAIAPLLDAGCTQLHIANRTASKAAALQAEMVQSRPAASDRLSASALDDISGEWDIIINATSSGLDDAAPMIAPGLYADVAMAYDMVYGAQPTAFMRIAQTAGAQDVADGLGMLVSQAAVSFSIWNGVTPDVQPVLQALRASLIA